MIVVEGAIYPLLPRALKMQGIFPTAGKVAAKASMVLRTHRLWADVSSLLVEAWGSVPRVP